MALFTCFVDPTQSSSKLALKYLGQLSDSMYELWDVNELDLSQAPKWLNGTPLVIELQTKNATRGSDALWTLQQAVKNFAPPKRARPREVYMAMDPEPPTSKSSTQLSVEDGMIPTSHHQPSEERKTAGGDDGDYVATSTTAPTSLQNLPASHREKLQFAM
tara:strand:- start:8980 stop:9462 length:483 start_codon:yes stop_codon:yes gene_type:complete